jgi:hypothetical protein
MLHPFLVLLEYGGFHMQIDRNDMLELTRRMTVARTCFSRMAGAYMDTDGEIDDSFNIHFLKLSKAEQDTNIAIAKKIPYAETNVKLKNYEIPKEKRKPGTIYQLLMALRECELKNDALLFDLYEYLGEKLEMDEPYAIDVFYGRYDVPAKGMDGASQWESEEVYRYMILTIGPVDSDYRVGPPVKGFLFPAFHNRCTDFESINIYDRDGNCDDFANLLWE